MRFWSSAGSVAAPARRRSAVRAIMALLAACAATAAAAAGATPAANAPADLVVLNARIYTESQGHAYAEALAVQAGKLVYVGTRAGAAAWTGSGTRTVDLKGRLVLPGLIDSHIHPTSIVDLDVCDLKSKAKSLKELTRFVSGCIERYKTPAGEWVNVRQWNFSDGNQPDGAHPTLRAALDLASTDHPIQLLGNDGHHGAFNSAALAGAMNAKKQRVGLSRATLATDFAPYAKLIGVDANGEPNGTVNEDARLLTGAPFMLFIDLPDVMKVPEKVTARLNSVGITGMLDAAVPPEFLPFYDKLEKSGKLSVRATLAQYYDPEQFRGPSGEVDYDRMVEQAKKVRAKYADDPLLRADVVKIFADGVLEGNPYAVPPTLPEVAKLTPYLQPIFGKDANGRLSVTGYVDTASTLCQDVRRNPAKYAAPPDVAAFIETNGYHPDQCLISSGQLQHDRAVILEFVKRFHRGRLQRPHPRDRRRGGAHCGRRHRGGACRRRRRLDARCARARPIGQPGGCARASAAIICTWPALFHGRTRNPSTTMSVVPFIDEVHGSGYAALHPAHGYYERAAYPFRSMKAAGATLVAGSDAPVDSRDPQPFVNIAIAVTRQIPGQPPLTPAQRISIEDAIDAYTINGARYLNRGRETGSLEVGKSADFIVLDRDILALAQSGHAQDILRTRVLETWFRGVEVYRGGLP